MKDNAQRSRAGKTLIELLVIIATASTVLSIAGQLLFRVSRTERTVREAVTISRAELRLIRDFRSDVRSATAADPDPDDDSAGIRLTGSGEEIVYRAADGGIERSSETRRELYRLGDIESRFRSDGSFAVLEVEPRRSTPGFAKAAPSPFAITAAIAADVEASPSSSGLSQENATKALQIRPVEAPTPERREP